jgi:protein-L-isoaspartate(D-aspartate) O-methyltransferase
MEPGDWPQAVIEFADRKVAEQIAMEHLGPQLATAQENSVITGWWFIRKTPFWRLRYWPAHSGARRHLALVLDGLKAQSRIVGWTAGIYEPEVFAFGGAAAMEVAHELFIHDSRHILDYLVRQSIAPSAVPGLGRRELAILLPTVLMRSAEQDWYEQGDVWAKVAQHRPAEHMLPSGHLNALIPAMHRLMTVDAVPAGRLVNSGTLDTLIGWFSAYRRAGQGLGNLARSGALERGLRAVLTHHVIFTWNRLGLPYAEQGALAALAKEVAIEGNGPTVFEPGRSIGRTTVSDMEAEMTDDTSTIAERLRNKLADQLKAEGRLRTERVEAAVRAVPRHVFVRQFKNSAALEAAYADTPVHTKFDGSGISISAVSQPTVNALMLELTQAKQGMQIQEAGAGSGLFAAYLGYLVGEEGHVFSLDVDQDLVDGARAGLAAAGVRNVTVILGDGALGHPDGAPYDRIVATVGAYGVPSAWLAQLAPGGRLVVPLRLRGSVSRAIAFECDTIGRWRSVRSEMCTFMPLRGIADDTRHMIRLTLDGSVTLQMNQEQTADAAALQGVLDQPGAEAWTGATFRGPESPEWMWLWLTCTLDNALSRISVGQPAIDSGRVREGFRPMAVVEKGDLAYLTLRKADYAADSGQLYEAGVIGHGPGGDELASRVADAIHTWDRDYRSRTAQFEIQPLNAEPIEPSPGRFAFDTPLNRIVIEWL